MTDAARDEAREQALLDALLDVLRLEDPGARTTEDIFTASSHPMPNGRVYGGQVLAQAVLAASATVSGERSVHSLHGYFLRPGDTSSELTFGVDRIHDGRSFSRRRTQAYQNGLPIFSMISSFQDSDEGLDYQTPMPEGIAAPEELKSDAELGAGLPPAAQALLTSRPIEIRHVDQAVVLDPNAPPTDQQAVWMRIVGRMPDDPVLHQAVLAYLSDASLQEPVLRSHGLTWFSRGLKVASLDHAMWFHRPARVDEWLLYVHKSPSSEGGRGLALGTIYSRDGELVANVTQEIMIRVP